MSVRLRSAVSIRQAAVMTGGKAGEGQHSRGWFRVWSGFSFLAMTPAEQSGGDAASAYSTAISPSCWACKAEGRACSQLGALQEFWSHSHHYLLPFKLCLNTLQTVQNVPEKWSNNTSVIWDIQKKLSIKSCECFSLDWYKMKTAVSCVLLRWLTSSLTDWSYQLRFT